MVYTYREREKEREREELKLGLTFFLDAYGPEMCAWVSAQMP